MATLTDETSLTQEENKDIHKAASILMQLSGDRCPIHSPEEDAIVDEVASTSQAHRNHSKKRKKDEQVKTQTISLGGNFSKEIRMEIDEWFKSEDVPQKIFNNSEVPEKFSKPIKKQLTSSDVKDVQSRLMLPRQKVGQTLLPFLEESENPPGKIGLDVSVYGPDGKVQEMKFKFWNGHKTPVLTTGWKEFVANYGLKMHTVFSLFGCLGTQGLVHQDMTAPLSHYFIYTGHNSYLTGNQLSSDCSEVPVIKALQRGVRVIELDLWPNSTGTDINVLHGRTLTTPVPLIKCLKSIRDYAFSSSPYPVIITLEDHLTADLQAKVAEMATQIFGQMLYYPESDSLEEFPSPASLLHRIIISTKPPKEYLFILIIGADFR